MNILSKPWFLAVLALLLMLGTQFAAFEISKKELMPKKPGYTIVHQAEPQPLHWGFSVDEIQQLKVELEQRLAEVEKRSTELDAFEARLTADRAEVEGIKDSVMEMREGLLQDIIRLEQAEEVNLRNLAKTYTEIDPGAAVSIFNELDDATVVKIMYFMKTNVQAEILQEMATQPGAAVAGAAGDAGEGVGAVRANMHIKRAARLSDMLRLFSNDQVTAQ